VHADLDTLVVALYVTIDELLGHRTGPGRRPSSATPNWSVWRSPKSCSGSPLNGAGCGSPTTGWATCFPTCRPHRPTTADCAAPRPWLPGHPGPGSADAELVGSAAPGRLDPGAVRSQPRDGQALGPGWPGRLRLLQEPAPLLLGLPAVRPGRSRRAAGRLVPGHPKLGEREVVAALLEHECERLRPGLLILGDKGFAGQAFEQLVAGYGPALLRPDRADEPRRHGSLGRVRQWIESTFDTLKDQLGLEQHGGRTLAGVWVRVAQRLLALAAAIWWNWQTGQPPKRSLVAYDH